MNRYSWLFIFLIGISLSCNTKSGNGTDESAMMVTDTVAIGLSEYETQQARVNRLLSDFEIVTQSLPSVSYSEVAEMGSRSIHYYFEDDNLVFIHMEASGEGGYAEVMLLQRDAEGETVLNYSSEAEGFFGYTGMQTSEWYKIALTGNVSPKLLARVGS